MLSGLTCADWTSDAATVAAQVGHSDGMGPTRAPPAAVVLELGARQPELREHGAARRRRPFLLLRPLNRKAGKRLIAQAPRYLGLLSSSVFRHVPCSAHQHGAFPTGNRTNPRRFRQAGVSDPVSTSLCHYSVLPSGGRTRRSTRGFRVAARWASWSAPSSGTQTPLGAPETWSPALRMMVRFLLANRFPLLLWWGPDYISIYNDAYRPILGTKHPWALGQPVSECWSEIWHVLRPLIDTPFNGGPPTWNEDFELEINRHGFSRRRISRSPTARCPDETAPRASAACSPRCTRSARRLSANGASWPCGTSGARGEAKTAEEACALAARRSAPHGKDLPFVLLYLIDADGRTANGWPDRPAWRRRRTSAPETSIWLTADDARLAMVPAMPQRRAAGRASDSANALPRAAGPVVRSAPHRGRRADSVEQGARAARAAGRRRQRPPEIRRLLPGLLRAGADADRDGHQPMPAPTRRSGSAPKRWRRSTARRRRSSATSATSSERR